MSSLKMPGSLKKSNQTNGLVRKSEFKPLKIAPKAEAATSYNEAAARQPRQHMALPTGLVAKNRLDYKDRVRVSCP